MAQSIFISKVQMVGLHGHQKFDLTLHPGLNVVHGRNGTGKTTLLHVLANLVEGDIERFSYLQFEAIDVTTSNDKKISLRKSGSPDSPMIMVLLNGQALEPVGAGAAFSPSMRELLRGELGGYPVYLPAFRSILDASGERFSTYTVRSEMSEAQQREYSTIRDTERQRRSHRTKPRGGFYGDQDQASETAAKTIHCRRWFGQFVPLVRYPSIQDVTRELSFELDRAHSALAATDREAFSSIVVGVLSSLLFKGSAEPPSAVSPLLEKVKDLLGQLDAAVGTTSEEYVAIAQIINNIPGNFGEDANIAARVLEVYAQNLEKRAHDGRAAFDEIRRFEESVNRFFERKRLVVGRHTTTSRLRSPVHLALEPDARDAPLSILSSGERHLLTLLFSATHMSSADGMVLIDEPELSLHTSWQRLILDELANQAGERQIIACTHAPAVAGKHRDRLVDLLPEEWVSQISLFSEGNGVSEGE